MFLDFIGFGCIRRVNLVDMFIFSLILKFGIGID